MEQIAQLKAMRDAAKARLMASPDWKLMVSLDALIPDLEKAFGMTPETEGGEDGEESSEEEPAPSGAAAQEDDPGEDPDAGEFEARDTVEGTAPAEPEPLESGVAADSSDSVELTETVVETVAVLGSGSDDARRARRTHAAAPVSRTAPVSRPAPASNGHVGDFRSGGGSGEPDLEVELELTEEMLDISAESEEDAVNRALDELSQDLADATREEVEHEGGRRGIFTFKN